MPLILDTDMGNDIDDALALAMIHSLQARGECELLGVAVSKNNPYAPAYVDVVNTFYGRGDVPIGVVRGGVTPEPGAFVRGVVDARDASGRPAFPRTPPEGAYEDAVSMLRRLLADATDDSVTVVMIGFSTNMARLLDSPPDAGSDLDGLALFERKVRRVVMMAGDFSDAVLADPSRHQAEYNIRKDTPSAQRFIARCPSPLTFSGLEVGSSIPYPASSIERDYAWADRHPVAVGYRLYKPMPYDRPTWDLTAVLYAVRPEAGYFGLSRRGAATVDDAGGIRFTDDPSGRHRYLTVDDTQRVRIGADQVTLASQPVGPHRPMGTPDFPDADVAVLSLDGHPPFSRRYRMTTTGSRHSGSKQGTRS